MKENWPFVQICDFFSWVSVWPTCHLNISPGIPTTQVRTETCTRILPLCSCFSRSSNGGLPISHSASIPHISFYLVCLWIPGRLASPHKVCGKVQKAENLRHPWHSIFLPNLPPFSRKHSSCNKEHLSFKGPYLNDVRSAYLNDVRSEGGRGGWPKSKRSKGGCLDLVLQINPNCWQGGRGSKIWKILRTSFKYGS